MVTSNYCILLSINIFKHLTRKQIFAMCEVQKKVKQRCTFFCDIKTFYVKSLCILIKSFAVAKLQQCVQQCTEYFEICRDYLWLINLHIFLAGISQGCLKVFTLFQKQKRIRSTKRSSSQR